VNFAAVSLWLSFLAKYKSVNVFYVGTGKYLSSTVSPIVEEQVYMMSELCHWYQRQFLYQINDFYTAETRTYWNLCANL